MTVSIPRVPSSCSKLTLLKGDDAVKGIPENIPVKKFSAKDVQEKSIHAAEATYLRAFDNQGDETSWVAENVKDFEARIPANNGCEVINGKAVKFT
jgi:hypothetical protein